jgi:hypothetical protein
LLGVGSRPDLADEPIWLRLVEPLTLSTSTLDARRRRRSRQLRLLATTPFDGPALPIRERRSTDDAILRASSVLDERELLAAWRFGRARLTAMADFERQGASTPETFGSGRVTG